MKAAIWLAERGYVPEWILRKGIRRLLAQRLEELNQKYGEDSESAMKEWIEHMRASPVALVPEKANEQHYEVPPEFFLLVLGPHLKYSSSIYLDKNVTPRLSEGLGKAESDMLALTCERAKL